MTIAVIAILASLLLPTLTKARERGRRTSCLSNIRQVILAAQLYAQDNDDSLPRPDSNCAAMMSKKTMTNMLRYGAVADLLDCPSIHSHFINRSKDFPKGWREQGPNVAIGYHYLGGHKNTPWLTQGTDSAITWISPQKFSEPSRTLVADLNSSYDSMTVVPHARKGVVVLDYTYLQANASGRLIYPAKVGAQGGNIGAMDGSVRWTAMRKLAPHDSANDWGGQILGWW